MSGGLLGKKLGMTQLFDAEGNSVPVTVIETGPCTVVQKKTLEKDGYAALQIGFLALSEKKVNKSYGGHFLKRGLSPFRHLREFHISDGSLCEVGESLDVTLFKPGDKIDVIGISKGKGFQGIIKRHKHKGGPAAHGSRFHRTTGSIGQRTSPGEVRKGSDMPGHMGDDRVSVRNLEVVSVRTGENLLLVRGGVPGANGNVVFVRMTEEVFDQRLKENSEQRKREGEAPSPPGRGGGGDASPS